MQGFITAYFASTLSVTLVGVPSVVYVGVVVLSVVSSVVATYFLYDSLYDEERAAEEEQLEDAAP